MACQYYVNGNWVTEEQFKEILNNGLLDNLIANKTIKLDKFRIDQNKVLSREEKRINRDTIPADKLANILAKEIKSRQGYPPNMLSALELTPDGQDFKIPLWASPFAKKFESLLTSLVTNKVIKQKFPGSSYVLGSEEGFKYREGDAAAGELKNSGIVFTKNFDASKGLQPLRFDPETGKMLPAQIMIPFKFRDESGKILPLEDFLTKDEDGKFILDTSKFPEKLLKLFGFRIPTQERNSMSAVEIVGFLPEASGDLVLAPRDFTKQMGSDFDVDKLYTYMYNHYYQDGKLYTNFLSDQKKIESAINIQKKLIENLKEEFKLNKTDRKLIDDYIKEKIEYTSEGNEIPTELAEKASEIISKSLNDDLKNKLDNAFNLLSVLNRSYKASRQNKILDIHLDIMTSNNPEVIASIIALDSFGEFEKLADDITKVRRDQGLIEDPITILSDSYQRTKFINATAGKNGVGAFSLDSTFNASSQGKNLVYSNLDDDTKQRLIDNNINDSVKLAKAILENNSAITAFGDLISYGELSNEYTLRSQQIIEKAKKEKRELTKKERESLKFKSSIIRALQSTSVDNEKAQILDKLNINDNTFDAIRALVSLGFEEKDIVGLITQEIIWEYIDNLKEAGSSLTGYTPDIEEKIFNDLADKYDKQKRYNKLPAAQKIAFDSISGEELINNIENKKLEETPDDKTTTPDFNLQQLALLEKFRNLTEVGKDIKKLQSSINAFSKGLPKSLIEVQSKLKQVQNLDVYSAKIVNADRLLGNINNDGELTNPTTLNGFATYYGTQFAGRIFNSYFPYSTDGFKSVAQEVQLHMPQGLNMSITRQAELQQEVFDNIKSFLYANSNTNLFGDNPDLERRRLFVDSRDNMSLASILSNLSSQEWYQKNGFLNKLSFDLNKNGKISRVMFESATGENFDERDIYDGFNYMLTKNFPVGEFNGIDYTSRMIAQELVAAAYLEGANQSAVQYLKYIPVAYLKSLGFGDYLSSTPFDFANTFFGNLTTGGPVYTMPSAFTRQYFQNNPSAAKTIRISDIEGTPDKLENSFKLNKDAIINNFVDIVDPATGDMTKTQTKFVSIYDPKEVSKYVLYEFDEVSREYKKIPVLSGKYDFVAYNSEKRFSVPVESENIVTTTPPQINLPGYGITNIPVEPTKQFDINIANNPVKVNTGTTLSISTDLSGTKEALDDLLNNLETADGVSKLNAQLMILLRNLELPQNFKIEYAKLGKTIKGNYNYTTNTLVLNTDIFNELSVDEIATTVNHELIHALTGKAIKLYEAGKLDELTNEQIKVIEKLKSVQELYINNLVKSEGREGLDAFAKAYAKFKQTSKKGDWTTEEISKYYGALKLSEFVTMALTDAGFQEELNKVQGEDGRTIWEQIKDLLAGLLNSLGLDIRPGSALTVAIKDSLDLIDINQQVFKKEVAPETIIEPGRYVTNNNVTYIVTKQNDNGTWQVLNPLAEGAQAKKSFAAANLKPTSFKANLVNYKGINYLVTPRNTIISLQTNKKMNWGEENGDRRAILALVNAPTPVQPTEQLTNKEQNQITEGSIVYSNYGLYDGEYEVVKIGTATLTKKGRKVDRVYKRDTITLKPLQGEDTRPFKILGSLKDGEFFGTENSVGESYSTATTVQFKLKPTQPSTSVKPNVILPIGTSGSGKSTFIKSLPQENLIVIEPDAMRIEFTGNINDKSKDKEIYEEAAKRAIAAIKQGKQVVFDTTNLTKDKRRPFIEAIKKEIPNANIQYKLMELNPELAKQRIKAQLERGESRAAVSDETIDRHAASYKQMLEDIKEEGITEYTGPTAAPKLTEVKENKFEYKGKTLDTAFTLTQGQDTALKELIDFVNEDDKKVITLQGAAGTGKTAVIGYLQKYFGGTGTNFIYMAPTHAATAELAFATVKSGNKELPMTVQSAVRESVDRQTGETRIGFTKKVTDKLGFGANVIVIDEVSMLSGKDYRNLKQAIKQHNAEVVFMGDIIQIPEVNVNNPDIKQVSLAFTEPEQINLTEVKRTGSNSILSVLTALRTDTRPLIPIVNNTEELKYLSGTEYNKELVDTVKKDPEDTLVISYTNAGVTSTNSKIRSLLGREGDLKKDDIIVGYLGYSSKQIENGNIANSIRYTVDNVEKDGSKYIITASSKKLKALKDAGVKVTGNATGIYLQLSPNDAFKFEDLTQEDFDNNNKLASEQMKKLYDAKQAALKNPRLWFSYYSMQGETAKFFADHSLGGDYIYNPATNKMEAYNPAVHSKLKSSSPELYVEKGIDFGHAITIHKAQGSTIKNVFFDATTLPSGSSSKLFQGENQVGNEKHSLIYVAMSRASNKLVVNTEQKQHFYNLSGPNAAFDEEGFYIGDTKDNMSLEDWENYNNIQDLFDESITESPISKDKYENYLLICGK